MRLWPLVLAGITVVTTPSPAVRAARSDYLDGAHWAVPGAADGRPGAVLVVDATADPRALEALRAFKAEWNAMRADPSLSALPAVELSTARPSEACSAAHLGGAALAPGRVVVCIDDGLSTAAVGGPYRVDGQGHTTLGVVKLRTATLAWSACSLRTAMAHELGHVMGLAHNDAAGFTGGASVMMSGRGPYGRGCPTWFNAHDRDALRWLYQQHATDARAQVAASVLDGAPPAPAGPAPSSRAESR